MCVSYPDTGAHARTHARIQNSAVHACECARTGPRWGPPCIRVYIRTNELPEVFFLDSWRETKKKRGREEERERDRMKSGGGDRGTI